MGTGENLCRGSREGFPVGYEEQPVERYGASGNGYRRCVTEGWRGTGSGWHPDQSSGNARTYRGRCQLLFSGGRVLNLRGYPVPGIRGQNRFPHRQYEYAGAFGEGEAVYSAGGDGSLSGTRRQHHHRT